MTTLNDWIDQTRDHLLSGFNERFNKLASDVAVDDTSITLAYDPSGIDINTDICIGLEICHVWEISDKTLTVDRAWRGTATSHYADDRVYVNTRFAPYRIAAELNNDLRALSSSGLYGIGTDTLTYSSSTPTHSFSPESAFRSVLEFRRVGADLEDWPYIQGELVRQLPEDVTDGVPFGIRFPPGAAADGDTVLVVYKKDLTTLDRLNDDVEDTGLPPSAIDIPPLGAAINIALSREIRRNDFEIQSDPRRAGEVPPNAMSNAARRLQDRYDMRVANEKKALNENFVFRKSKYKNAALMMSGSSGMRRNE